MEIYKAELSKKYENPIGLEFYTFYLEKSKRGTKFNKDTGIFKVKIIKETSNIVFKEYEYKVVELFKKPKIGTYNIEYFINSFHACSANFLYDNYNDAAIAYDEIVLDVLKNPRCSSYEIETLEKMLIKKPTEIEIATNWYNSLENLHKSYLKILGLKL